MRALILSDIHGNLQALDAVLAAASAAHFDTLWNLGDTVGYGGSPNEVIDRIRPLAALTVRGNHDRVCCGLSSSINFNPIARAAVEWTKAELTPENLAWLRDLPQGPLHPGLRPSPVSSPEPILVAAGTTAPDPAAPLATEPDLDPTSILTAVACAHGSPLHEDHYILSMRDAWAPLQQSPAPITFIGHTHIQGGFIQHGPDPADLADPAPNGKPAKAPQPAWHELRPRFHARSHAESWTLPLDPADRYLMNPGSVGQPRDGDWRAAFAIFDTTRNDLTFHRVPYDLTAAQGHILMAGLPEHLAARLREGR